MAKISEEVKAEAITGIRAIYKDDPVRAEQEVNHFRLICELGEPPFVPRPPWWLPYYRRLTSLRALPLPESQGPGS